MIQAFLNIFRIPELRQKLWTTVLLLPASQLPLPCVGHCL